MRTIPFNRDQYNILLKIKENGLPELIFENLYKINKISLVGEKLFEDNF